MLVLDTRYHIGITMLQQEMRVETLMNFSLTPGSEKMQSLIVEISKLIESELMVNLTQALITVFLRK